MVALYICILGFVWFVWFVWICKDLYGCLVCLDIGGLALGGYTLGNGHSMQTDKKHRNMGIQI